MSRSILLIAMLALTTLVSSACKPPTRDTPSASASAPPKALTFDQAYKDANSDFSKLYSRISRITAKVKSRGAPDSVRAEYASLREVYNTYLTYYSGCIEASACVTSTLEDHEKAVEDSYTAYIQEINSSTSTAGQDPLTATAVIALLKELTPIAKDVYSWIKEKMKEHTEAERARQSKLVEALRSDWQLKAWDNV